MNNMPQRRSFISRTPRTVTNAALVFVAVLALAVIAAQPAPAQTFTQVAKFDLANGSLPYSPLVQGLDGNLYGTTLLGGANSGGTIYKMTPTGTLTTFYNFCSLSGCADGSGPYGGLVQATDGNFYGTTVYGGASNPDWCTPSSSGGCGTVFEITPAGALTTLYSFCSAGECLDGSQPWAGLVQAPNGNFYGTTFYGGSGVPGEQSGGGAVFEITPAGQLTTIYNFSSNFGCLPSGALTVAANGDLYGTAQYCGDGDDGTIFDIAPNGTVTILNSFDVGYGEYPNGEMIQATDGNLYGTAANGGDSRGTVFSSTPSGTLGFVFYFPEQAPTATSPRRAWSRRPMEPSTGQQARAGAPCSIARGVRNRLQPLHWLGPVCEDAS